MKFNFKMILFHGSSHRFDKNNRPVLEVTSKDLLIVRPVVGIMIILLI